MKPEKSNLNVIMEFISHYKYLIVIIWGVVIVGFLGEDSVLKRAQLELKISELEADIKKYKSINESASNELRELKRNPDAIGKIARERYFMKADDEDIFVLSDDENYTSSKTNMGVIDAVEDDMPIVQDENNERTE
jgi:cell division protein FtsB